MRVLTCLVAEHNLWLVLIAALMCTVGASLTINLFRRAFVTDALPRNGWVFLTAVCAGSSIWATHFIAMLGYETAATVTFDPVLTIASILIAILGTGFGFAIAAFSRSRTATIVGGGLVGLAVSAMHYTGMFAYRVQGIVTWDQAYVFASIILASALAAVSVASIKRCSVGPYRHVPAVVLLMAIVSLHFTGMAAFQVTPMSGPQTGLGADAMQAMALSVLIVGLIIVGTGISSYLIDDRMRAASTEQLRKMAFQDALTGLANRRSLQDQMEEDSGLGRSFTLLLLDLDHFKTINDTYGHGVGDKLLVHVARRLESLMSGKNFAARIGGDELAVLVYDDIEVSIEIAKATVQVIAQPFQIDQHHFTIGCSIGICATADAANDEQLMKQADLALYEAKRLGRGRAFRYAPGMSETAAARHQLEEDIRTGIREGQFYLAYQPLVDLGTNELFGYEALIRWNHPTRGLVSPADFIPLAEENGSILEIGQWVVGEACHRAASWPNTLHVAVNVSAVQFKSAVFFSHVTQALAASGLLPHRLELELTETAIVSDGEKMAQALSDLRALGVRIAMDDFGTGYSSLAHIRDLPLDRIKIDRSFVASAHDDPNALAVLQAITQMGRTMGIPTLAEGVETLEQLQMLRELGCDAVQGYLLGKPQRLASTTTAAAA
ncbi:MAG TPA: bifunctional diguanylate cyclase/phosphodiesterase [Tianweitania sediminis]|jgi:diguanylate cyclase (GGDEF)-like protein|nr:bifunctional diguanylate cyclase/phosphodiesterase [Tianweitania sediminis]